MKHKYNPNLRMIFESTNKKGESRGFTLTEMTIVIAIFILIITAVYSTYILNQRAYLRGEEMAEITQNGRVILERMTREIRQAREIVTKLSDDETEASSIIEFEDGHITIRYHYIRYFRDDNNNILREVITYCFSDDGNTCDPSEIYCSWDTDAPLAEIILEESRIIGEYVTNLEFWGSRVINVALTLEEEASINLATKIFGRNL